VPAKPLTAAMPISLRRPGDTAFTTQATMMLVNLHTHVADPIRRLRAIRDAASAVKAIAGRAKGIMPTDFPSIAVPWVLHGLANLYGKSGLAGTIPPIANVVISNVPGPQVPLYVAGARMHTYWPLSIPEHGVGLNITVMSYAGAMGFGFVAARNAVPDTRQLARALEAALEELLTKSQPRRVARTRTSAGGTAAGARVAAPTRSRAAARPRSAV
jgi:diacylglycerol O-acyltransferase